MLKYCSKHRKLIGTRTTWLFVMLFFFYRKTTYYDGLGFTTQKCVSNIAYVLCASPCGRVRSRWLLMLFALLDIQRFGNFREKAWRTAYPGEACLLQIDCRNLKWRPSVCVCVCMCVCAFAQHILTARRQTDLKLWGWDVWRCYFRMTGGIFCSFSVTCTKN